MAPRHSVSLDRRSSAGATARGKVPPVGGVPSSGSRLGGGPDRDQGERRPASSSLTRPHRTARWPGRRSSTPRAGGGTPLPATAPARQPGSNLAPKATLRFLSNNWMAGHARRECELFLRYPTMIMRVRLTQSSRFQQGRPCIHFVCAAEFRLNNRKYSLEALGHLTKPIAKLHSFFAQLRF